MASNVWGVRAEAVEPFVTLARGGSVSLLAMLCSACIVVDWGGVFSPNVLWGGRLSEGLTCMESRLSWGDSARFLVGVVARAESLSNIRSLNFSGDSSKNSLLAWGVTGLGDGFSGNFIGPKVPLSMKPLRSRTLPFWRDCIRLCPGAAPLIRRRSGDGSVKRLGGGMSMVYVLLRALSVSAAWADLMAADVPREDTLGEEGFIGSGGGARSGSELSHLQMYGQRLASAYKGYKQKLTLEQLRVHSLLKKG